MRVVVVDGRDSEVFGRFFGVRDRVRREWEFPAGLGVDEALVLFAGEHADMRVDGLGVVDGDEWRGIVWLDWWLLENTDTVDVELAVESRSRRRGIGSRLLDEAIERARSDGRTRLSASVIADAVTGESAGTAFAGARGFVRKHSELHQVLELPLSAGQIDGLDRPVAGYEIVQWREHTPDDWLERFADALRAMSEDVPQGESGLEATRWTPERIRQAEARRLAQGRFCHTTAAVDGDGRLAAYTQMGGATGATDLYQFDTFVRPEHRGKRLGMAVKVPNLRSLQAGLDHRAVLHTWNAPENAPMIAVNNHLGFRAVDQLITFQRTL